ncbi:MAG: hypothetical protein LRS48_05290 [Desulfurococcales archaeon]|nr:hypothetical protein [Desulfurococcales archaeon]
MTRDNRVGEGGWLPPFASGRLAADYSLLREYWRVARERGREDLVERSMLSEELLELLRSEIHGGESAADVLERLASKLEDRIDESAAVEAARRRGLESIDGATARRLVARLLAAWLLEAGDYWGHLKLRGKR